MTPPTASSSERLVRTAAARTQGVARALRDRAPVGGDQGPTAIRQSITIERSREEILPIARDPHALSTVLGDLGRVATTGGDRFAWTITTPGDATTEFDTELVETPNGLLWRTADDADGMPAQLTLTFEDAPQDRGTEVALRLELELPPGTRKAAATVAGGLALKALHRFKALVVTGEVPTLRHTPAARDGGADHDLEG